MTIKTVAVLLVAGLLTGCDKNQIVDENKERLPSKWSEVTLIERSGVGVLLAKDTKTWQEAINVTSKTERDALSQAFIKAKTDEDKSAVGAEFNKLIAQKVTKKNAQLISEGRMVRLENSTKVRVEDYYNMKFESLAPSPEPHWAHAQARYAKVEIVDGKFKGQQGIVLAYFIRR